MPNPVGAIFDRAAAQPWEAQGIYIYDGAGSFITKVNYNDDVSLAVAKARAQAIVEAVNVYARQMVGALAGS